MRPLGAAVARVLRTLRLDDELAEADAVSRWPAAAATVLGTAASETKAVRVERGTLVVAVPDATWAGELRLRERELVAALRAIVPRTRVSRLRAVPSRENDRAAP